MKLVQAIKTGQGYYEQMLGQSSVWNSIERNYGYLADIV